MAEPLEFQTLKSLDFRYFWNLNVWDSDSDCKGFAIKRTCFVYTKEQGGEFHQYEVDFPAYEGDLKDKYSGDLNNGNI